jgi:hypothetical protein
MQHMICTVHLIHLRATRSSFLTKMLILFLARREFTGCVLHYCNGITGQAPLHSRPAYSIYRSSEAPRWPGKIISSPVTVLFTIGPSLTVFHTYWHASISNTAFICKFKVLCLHCILCTDTRNIWWYSLWQKWVIVTLQFHSFIWPPLEAETRKCSSLMLMKLMALTLCSWASSVFNCFLSETLWTDKPPPSSPTISWVACNHHKSNSKHKLPSAWWNNICETWGSHRRQY